MLFDTPPSSAYKAMLMFPIPRLRRARASRVRGSVCALFGVLLSGFHVFGQFVVNDTVVSSPDVSLIDPEFADASQLMTVKDTDGRLWLNHVDATTGTWSPKDGRQWLLDDQLAHVGQGPEWRQGAEWVLGRGGDSIVYTKNVGGVPTLYEAWNWNRQWFTAPLPLNFYCSVIRGSKEVDDPSPRVLFLYAPPGTDAVVGWQTLKGPYRSGWIPGARPKDPRWAYGMRGVVFTVRGSNEVSFYNIETQRLRELTSDGVPKRSPNVWLNRALSSSPMLGVVVADRSLALYLPNETGWSLSWRLNAEMPSPSQYPFILGAEYFEFRGRSFLHFTTASSNSGKELNVRGEAEVWFVEISSNGEFLKPTRVNNTQVKRIKDSESLVTANTAYIYYAEILADGTRVIHRCDTGLF
jgi:hypothetical protein